MKRKQRTDYEKKIREENIIAVVVGTLLIWGFVHIILLWIVGAELDISVSSTAGSYGTEGTSYHLGTTERTPEEKLYSRLLMLASGAISFIIAFTANKLLNRKR